MEIVVRGETELVVTNAGGGLSVREDEGGRFGPLPMMAASLGTCTLSVLLSWAENADLDPSELKVVVRWEYVDDPYRVGSYEQEIRWPGLPEDRHAAARKVADQCTVHHTLEHPPEMSTRVVGDEESQEGDEGAEGDEGE